MSESTKEGLCRSGDVWVEFVMEKSIDVNSITMHEKKSSFSSKKSSSKDTFQESSKSATSTNHWSTTKDGILVAKLTSFIYRKIITSGDEGGLKAYNFFLLFSLTH
jgi:hypothetical protein